jgi:ABC-type Fe3+-hydroxamate transport system substrate-binding protein
MLKMAKFLSISGLIAGACWGQSQVATVSASSSFTLRGASFNPGQGVPSWPVLAGDKIVGGTSPVTMTFPDGSTITLNPGAEATVDLSGQTPVFHLTKGTAHYSLKSLNSVQVTSANQAVTLTSLTGTIGKGGGGLWTPAHATWGIIGAGAASGLGVGVAQATSGGSSVSPSH